MEKSRGPDVLNAQNTQLLSLCYRFEYQREQLGVISLSDSVKEFTKALAMAHWVALEGLWETMKVMGDGGKFPRFSVDPRALDSTRQAGVSPEVLLELSVDFLAATIRSATIALTKLLRQFGAVAPEVEELIDEITEFEVGSLQAMKEEVLQERPERMDPLGVLERLSVICQEVFALFWNANQAAQARVLTLH